MSHTFARRAPSAILVILLLLGSLAPVASGQGASPMELSIGHYPGGSFTVAALMLSNVTDFGSIDLNLSYDPSVVHVKNVTAGNVPGGQLVNGTNNVAGTTLIHLDTLDAPSGSFVLAYIGLDPRGAGSTALTLAISEAVDATFANLPVQARSGSFGQSSPPGSVSVRAEVPTVGSVTSLVVPTGGSGLATSPLEFRINDSMGDKPTTGAPDNFSPSNITISGSVLPVSAFQLNVSGGQVQGIYANITPTNGTGAVNVTIQWRGAGHTLSLPMAQGHVSQLAAINATTYALQVRDQFGNNITNAQVRVLNQSGALQAYIGGTGAPDFGQDGIYIFNYTAPLGDTAFFTRADAGGNATYARIALAGGGGGGGAGLDVQVNPNNMAEGTAMFTVFVNASGSPVQGASLTSTPVNIFANGTLTDSSGRYAFFGNLSAGNYTIRADTTSPARNGSAALTVNPSGGGGGGGGCTGAASLSGTLSVTGSPPSGSPKARARSAVGGCTSISSIQMDGSWAITGIASGAYDVEAFIDANGNNQFDGNESITASVAATAPQSGIALSFNFGGGGGGSPGGGSPGGGMGPIQGSGNLSLGTTIFYNGSRTTGTLFGGFFPKTEGSGGNTTPSNETGPMGFFGQFANVSDIDADGLPFTINGFTAGEWGLDAWVEADGFGGPGAFEPLAFLKLDGVEQPQNGLMLSANATGYVIEVRDAPEDGWPLDLIGGPGDGGGPGGPGGGCSGDSGYYVNGTVTNQQGQPVGGGQYPPGVEFINQTSNRRTFIPLNGDGTYSCRLLAGNYTAEVHSEQGFAFAPQFTLSADHTLNFTVSFNARPPYERPTTYYGGTVWGNLTVNGQRASSGVTVRLFPQMSTSGPGSPGGGFGGCQPRDPYTNSLNTCGGEAETNNTGNFVFTYLGAGTYDLNIEGTGIPMTQVFGAVTIPEGVNNSTVYTVSLSDISINASFIRGRINLSSDGSPVNGAFVNAFPNCQGGGPCMGGFAETNATGNYTIAVQPGSYGMSVTGPAGANLAPQQVECYPGSPDCVVVTQGSTSWQNFTLTAGATIRGRVVDGSGNGVRAFLNAMECPPPSGPAFTPCTFAWGQTDSTFGPGGPSSSGFFNLSVAAGTYELRVEPDRWSHSDLSVRTITNVLVNTSQTRDIGNVQLSQGARLRGNVTAGGAPVPYVNLFAEVHVEGMGEGFRGPSAAFAFTDANGAYDMTGLQPGSYDITVEPGWGSQYMRTTVRSINVSEGGQWRDIELSGGGTLTGYVLTNTGEPVANAFVDAFWQPQMTMGPGPGPGPQMPPSSGGWGHAQTDANGRYSIGGLTTGTFGMFVNPPFGSSYTSAHLDPFRDTLPNVTIGNTTWRNFTLGAGATLRVCVNDGSQNINNSWVSAFSFASGFGGGEPTRGPDGCANIRGIRPGTYSVEVQPPFNSPYARKIQDGVVVNESETKTIVITLSAGVFINGQVTSGGTGVANAFVNVFQIMEGGPGGGPGVFGFAQTNATGHYNVTGLQPGRYGMHVQPAFNAQLSAKFIPEITIPDGGRVGYGVVLGGGGWIHGQVTSGGSGVANAWVGAFSFNGGSGGGTITNATGHFNISGLSASSDYNLDVFPPFDRQDLAGQHFFPLTVAEGAGTLRNVGLSAGGTLTGRVVNSTGAGVQYAFVNVNGNGTFGWGSTDSGGNFTIRGLSANAGDTMQIFVQPGPGQSFVGNATTHVWAPNSDSVSNAGNISVGAGITLSGRVLRGGLGVSDVNVYVWPGLPYMGPPIGGQATSGVGGWFNVTGLPSGYPNGWDVSAQPSDGSAGNFTPYAVFLNDSGYMEINLTGGGDISVQALTNATTPNAPVQGARVDCFNESVRAGRGNTTDANGYANGTGLPAGVYGCRVFGEGYRPAHVNVTIVASTTASATVWLTTVSPATVYGNFTNGTGNASSHFVLVVPNGTVHEDDATGFNTTNASGSFVIPNMPPGERYDISVLDASGNVVAAIYNRLLNAGANEVGTIARGSFTTGS